MKTTYYKQIILTAILASTILATNAQQDTTKLHKEVEVSKAYKPTISDAYKINENPLIAKPSAEKPVFDYQIKTQPMITDFEIEPVEAARMKTEPGDKLNKGFLKLGAGNYLSQYGEFYYNAKAGRNSSIGLHLKSDLSNGKIKLENGDKVKAPQNTNMAELFTNHGLRSGTFKTKISFEQDAIRYYGYTGEGLSDEDKQNYISEWNKKQAFSKAGVQLNYDKKYKPSNALNFNTGLKYQYFGTKTGQTEHLVKWDGQFKAPIDLMEGVLDAGITYSSADSVWNDLNQIIEKRNQVVLKMNPAAVFDSEVLKFRLGVNSYTVWEKGKDSYYMLAPNTKIEYSPAPEIITLYAGTDGYLKQNNYSAIAAENPFVFPEQNIKHTKYRYILTGGIRGKFAPTFSYLFQLDYANIKDEHFYYLKNTEITENSTPSLFRNNTFDVQYDKVKQLSLKSEMMYAFNQEVSIRLQAKYNTFKLDSLQEAWLKPQVEATASVYFDPEGPLRFTADLYYIGSRKALIQTQHLPLIGDPTYSNEVKNLDAILDLNLGVEYQFNGHWSFWGQTNNFTFKRYELFPGYTRQSFSVLAGVSYAF